MWKIDMGGLGRPGGAQGRSRVPFGAVLVIFKCPFIKSGTILDAFVPIMGTDLLMTFMSYWSLGTYGFVFGESE